MNWTNTPTKTSIKKSSVLAADGQVLLDTSPSQLPITSPFCAANGATNIYITHGLNKDMVGLHGSGISNNGLETLNTKSKDSLIDGKANLLQVSTNSSSILRNGEESSQLVMKHHNNQSLSSSSATISSLPPTPSANNGLYSRSNALCPSPPFGISPKSNKIIGMGRYCKIIQFNNEELKQSISEKELVIKVPINKDGEESLEREIEALDKLDVHHPGIVEHFKLDDSELSLVMPLYKPLQKVLSYPLSMPLLWTIAQQVFETLSFVHDRGVIHGDIKPDNLLVEKVNADDQGGDNNLHLRLCDFGQSVIIENEIKLNESLYTNSSQSSLLMPPMNSQLAGTTAYSAPECLSMHPTISPASDIYSAGATLYTLSSGGRVPFQGLSGAQLIIRIREGFFRAVRTAALPHDPLNPLINPHITCTAINGGSESDLNNNTTNDQHSSVCKEWRRLCRLLVWCTRTDPADRPTAKQVIQEIEEIKQSMQ